MILRSMWQRHKASYTLVQWKRQCFQGQINWSKISSEYEQWNENNSHTLWIKWRIQFQWSRKLLRQTIMTTTKMRTFAQVPCMHTYLVTFWNLNFSQGGDSYIILTNMLDCNIIVCKFEPQLHFYIHYGTKI